MEEPIRKDDILDFEGTLKGIKDLIDAFDNLNVSLKKDLTTTVADLTKEIQSYNTATKEGQTNLKNASDATDNLVQQQKALSKLDQDAIKLKAQLNALNSDEAKTVAELKVAIQEKTAALKADAQASDNAIGSVNDMRAKLKAMIADYNALGSAAAKDAAPAINKLSDELKKAESQVGNNTRGVGSYTKSIKDAAVQLFNFLTPVTAVTLLMGKLKDAFAGTEQGVRTFSESSAIIRTFFDELVTGKNKWNVKELFKDLILSGSDATKLDDFRKKTRDWNIEQANQLLAIKQLRLQATNTEQGSTEQIAKLKLAEELENAVIKEKTDHLKEYIAILDHLLTITPTNTKLLDERNAKQLELIQVQGDNSLRIASKIDALTTKQNADANKTLSRAEELALKTKTAIDKGLDTKKSNPLENELAGQIDEINNIMKTKTEVNPVGKLVSWTPALDKDAKITKNNVKKNIDDIGNLYDKANAKVLTNQEKFNETSEKLEEADAKAKRNIALGIQDFLSALAGQNKTLQVAALIASKVAAIAEIIIQTQKANAAITAWGDIIGPPFGTAMALGIKIKNNISEGIQIAAVVAAAAAGIAGLKMSHGGSGIVNGPVHVSGGVRVPGVGTVEGGEHFAVTSRAMTSRYGASMLDAVSKSINQGKFFEVWANVNKDMGLSDPYTKKMYELMKNTPTTYIDTEGNTVKEYPGGRKDVIKRMYRN
jgi:hypothetical protein